MLEINILDITFNPDVWGTVTDWLMSIVTIITAYYLYQTLKSQNDANEQQKKDLKIERFENKFYKLLDLHKANVDEASIGGLNGRETFVHRFYELSSSKLIVDFNVSVVKSTNKDFDENQINKLEFAYVIFFYGIGKNSEKNYINNFNKSELILYNSVVEDIKKIQYRYESFFETNSNKTYFPIEIVGRDYEFFYYPFEGHHNKLGHYYRHLLQTARFVVEQKKMTDKKKYKYIKTLRAQLSNYEQLMIFYNAQAWFDLHWRELCTKYKLIKNLPVQLADLDIRPEIFYQKEILEYKEKGINIFERIK